MRLSIIFVVGLQKSGTSLMAHLLRRTGLVSSPWAGEGDDFWGNMPAFSPTGHPAGTVYQRHGGDRGHEIGPADATPEVAALFARRMRELAEVQTPLVVNKNPFNIVRLRWIRALFPDARIVAMVRRPVPNVFSLLKKHSGGTAAVPPDQGWWGVKPAGWHKHVADSAVERCAWQWSAVNRSLSDDRGCVDEIVAYHRLCRDPTPTVERVLGRAVAKPLAPEPCFDDEFRRGSELLSKNRYFWNKKALREAGEELIELPALEPKAVAAIERLCADTEALFPELT